MVKIKLLLGLGTTAVVGGAGTAVYFGMQSGTDEKEKEGKGKERDKKTEKPKTGPKTPSSDSKTSTEQPSST